MPTRLALAACLLLAAAPPAGAQSLTFSESDSQDGIINKAECEAGTTRLTLSWTIASAAATAYDLWVSDQSGCPPASTTSTAHSVNLASSVGASGTYPATGASYTVRTLLNQIQVVNCNPLATAAYVCMFPTGTTTGAVATLNIPLDFATPPAPTVNSVTAGDAALEVSWVDGAGSSEEGTTGSAASYRVYFGVQGSDLTTFARVVGSRGHRITGLQNSVAYDVQVSALTQGGNEGARSAVATGTPSFVYDFFRLYRQDGGVEEGGCATGSGGLLALLGLVPLALRRRRRS